MRTGPCGVSTTSSANGRLVQSTISWRHADCNNAATTPPIAPTPTIAIRATRYLAYSKELQSTRLPGMRWSRDRLTGCRRKTARYCGHDERNAHSARQVPQHHLSARLRLHRRRSSRAKRWYETALGEAASASGHIQPQGTRLGLDRLAA